MPATTSLRGLVEAGRLDLPLPGRGDTPTRLEALSRLGSLDLSLARLAEGHVDAVAILAEAAHGRVERAVYGVWAATSPEARVVAERSGTGWRLAGRKQFCSGADVVDRALVTADADDGVRLFDVDCALASVQPVPGTWPTVGMAESNSVDVVFNGVDVPESDALAEPGFYTGRPGFWHGAVGVSACWYGGALGLVKSLLSGLATGQPDDHQLAHLGAVTARGASMAATLDAAARQIDADPGNVDGAFPALALQVRHLVEDGCTEVLTRVGRAGGARPMTLDRDQSQRAADLYVYLRQHHSERDLARLGRHVLGLPTWP